MDETRWHSDGSSWSEHEQRNIDRDEPFFFFKLALYLDPLDGESGACRVIPGSHLVGDAYADGLQEQLTAQRSEDDAALSPLWQGAALPAHVCCTQPGDVVVFQQSTKHSSWNGGKARRMFTINWSPKIRDEIDQAVYERTVAGHKYSHSHVFGAGARPLLDDAPPERKTFVYCIQVTRALSHNGSWCWLRRDPPPDAAVGVRAEAGGGGGG